MVLTLPCETACSLVPDMEPFACGSKEKEAPVAEVQITFSTSPIFSQGTAVFLEESRTDMGHVQVFLDNSGYTITIRYSQDRSMAILRANADFSKATVELDPCARNACNLVSSALRIVFSQAVTSRHAMAVHASCVVADGKAYMFCGASGAGKSTHSQMWLKAVPGATLLNDDCPIVRLRPRQGPIVYGSPWSGKTPCHLNACAPLAAMIRVSKGNENRFIGLSGTGAYASFLPGCSSLRSHGDFFPNVCDTLQTIVQEVQTGIIQCMPQPQAATLCHSSIQRTIN